MRITRKILSIIYILLDYGTAIISWTLFFAYREIYVEHSEGILFDQKYILGVTIIPLYWLLLYWLDGMYEDPYKRYRFKDFKNTLKETFVGSIGLFFLVVLDDEISHYNLYYSSLIVLFTVHFVITFFSRILLTQRVVKAVHKGKIGFATLIIGGGNKALNIYDELTSGKVLSGFQFHGFCKVNGIDHNLESKIPMLGHFTDIQHIVEENNIEEVIIAIEKEEHTEIQRIITELENTNVEIKVIPQMYDILSGSVKMTSIFGAPLISIDTELMPKWHWVVKRLMDIIISVLSLVFLFPVFLIVSILIPIYSKGPVFFKQIRIGKHKKPFYIYKFRSMYIDAEKHGPQLSSDNDPRITPIGRFLRKTRIDEFPQFFNVIKGDMSLVGPRPERKYYIDKITARAPHYSRLNAVRPGITSWGQVKFGYAENVDQMIDRLKFDVLYVENMSLALDIKILLYTIIIMLKGKGK